MLTQVACRLASLYHSIVFERIVPSGYDEADIDYRYFWIDDSGIGHSVCDVAKRAALMV